MIREKIGTFFSKLGANLVAKSGNAGYPFDLASLEGGPGQGKLTRPYEKSVWVMRAIKNISLPIQGLDIELATDKRQGAALVEDPRLLEWLAEPVQGLTRADAIEAMVIWLKLSGEYFLIMDDTWLRPFMDVGSPSKLILARPDRMRHIVKDGVLEGWEFTKANQRKEPLLPEQVIHVKNYNPYNPWRGLSELTAAEIAAESDYLSGQFVHNLMQNNGDAGVYVVAKGQPPTDEQREQIIQALRMKKQRANRGDLRPIFLSGDMEIEDPKIQTPDASFLQTRLQNRHEIFMAFGVPASMADIVASYSIGSASDRFRLIEDACMPSAEKIVDGLEVPLGKLAGRRVHAWFNWDEHSVMQKVREERMETAVKLWEKGMPWEKINEYLNLGLPEFEGWDMGYLPFSVAPVGDLQDPATDPSFSEPTEEDEEEEPEEISAMFAALRERMNGGQKTVDSETDSDLEAFRKEAAELGIELCECCVDSLEAKAEDRDEKEVARWREHMAKRRAVMKDFEGKWNRELMKARAVVLENIEKLVAKEERTAAAPKTKAAAAELIFNLENFRVGFLAAMRKAQTNGLNEAGKQLYEELSLDDPFTMTPEEVLTYVARRRNKLAGIADDTWERVKEELQAGLDAGESQEKLSDRIRGKFNQIGKGRARVIAQTETAAAYGAGRQTAMERSGLKKKQWLTSGNSNVRAAHRRANGQVVDIDKDFMVGGEALKHPGDPSGSPANVINCHCVSIPVEDQDNDN